MTALRRADIGDQIPEIWSTDLYAQAEKKTFFNRFEGGEGSGMPIIRVDDLTKQAGDTIKTDMVLALTGSGMTGDTALLEGNEEALKFRQTSFGVDSLQHAVRWSKLGKILINHDMRRTALRQLSKWYAGAMDTSLFLELTGNGDTTMPTKNLWAAGTATSRDTVADTNAGGRLTLDTLTELKAYAQTELLMEPVMMEDGEEIFYFVAHPYAILSLKRDDTKWAQAQRDAQVRGNNNPLFTGAVGMWDGVVILSSNRVPRSLNDHATTDIMVSDNLLLGAQAASRGYAYYPDWTEEYFSYGQEQGIATFSVFGQKLNVFDLNATAAPGAPLTHTAIGAMVVYSAAVAPTA